MHVSELKLGLRVVSNNVIDVYPLGVWLAGTCGTVTAIETVYGQFVTDIKLDEHFACLNSWDNCLVVWSERDEANSDLRLSNFDVI